MIERRLSVAQVAELWGCTRSHVYALIASGKLGHVRIGSLIRLRPSDIEAFEAAQCRAPDPNDQPIHSPAVGTAGISSGGRTDERIAFQRAQRITAKRSASSPHT